MEEFTLDPATISKLKQQVETRLSDKNSKNGSSRKSNQSIKKKSSDGSEPRTRTLERKPKDKGISKDLSAPKTKAPGSKTKAAIATSESSKKPSGSKGKQGRPSGLTESASSTLRDEVLALGGDEEDLGLIDGVDSSSELDVSKSDSTDKALQKELSKFMKGLPFAETKVEDSDETADSDSAEIEDNVSATVSDAPGNLSFKQLIVEPQSEWFNIKLAGLPTSQAGKLPEKTIAELLSYGKDLLKKENKIYADLNASSSSHKFYKEMMVSGTLTDKISALTLSVQESPLHNQQPLEALVALAKKRSRSQAVQVLGALKDLFGAGALLPADRRLKHFASQTGLQHLPSAVFQHWNRSQTLPQPLLKEHLLLWAYEDWLKSTYFEIIKVLEVWSNDEITYSRLKSIDYIYDLLKEKPEQEANLLHLLVNKLGDPEKQVASRVSSHLVQLQIPHPFMKSVIISNVEANVLFKPGETWHAKYYAIITLNQTVLNSGQQDVIRKLLDIYFSMFLSILGNQKFIEGESEDKKETKPDRANGTSKKQKNKNRKPTVNDIDLREKITSGILSGINRAYPYVASNDDFFETRLDTLFKITHSSNFNTSIQALMLLQQLCTAHPAASDRFYRTLYESLLDPRLLTTSKHALYINLLYRAMKADTSVKRVQAFVKRLGQIISMHQPPFVCAVVYLIKDLEETFPSLHSLVDQPEAHDDGDEDDANVSKRAYDGKKRDPQFSNADRCCIWEMHPLTTHFHPSVSLFVSKFLSGQKIESKPDLSIHTLITFLDRFVYRNPKKITDALKGVSLMQPMAIANTSDMLVSGRASGKRRGPALNTIDFANMNDNKVQADEVFFHKYFSVKERGKEAAQKKKDKKRKAAEVDSEAGEENENEDEIWKALVESQPELGDDESDLFDEDGDLSDMESVEMDNDDILSEEPEDDGDIMELEDDEDALLGSDEELDLSDLEPEEDTQVDSGSKLDDIADSRGRKKRKLLKDLPTFASAEDYAKLLQEEEDGL